MKEKAPGVILYQYSFFGELKHIARQICSTSSCTFDFLLYRLIILFVFSLLLLPLHDYISGPYIPIIHFIIMWPHMLLVLLCTFLTFTFFGNAFIPVYFQVLFVVLGNHCSPNVTRLTSHYMGAACFVCLCVKLAVLLTKALEESQCIRPNQPSNNRASLVLLFKQEIKQQKSF